MISKRLVGLLVFAQLLGAVAFARAAKPVQQEELADQVRKAIDRGILFLRQEENERQGNWDNAAGGPAPAGGPSSLAVLALLNAGFKPDDPVIQRGLKYLRTLRQQSTYVVGLQTMVFVEAGQKEDRERIQNNVNWLIANRVVEDGKLRGWSYPRGAGTDNSNTQYALLGLHAGKVAGAKIDREIWESIRTFYMETQHATGGWNYSMRINEPPRLTMTTAGFCGLLIAGMELNEGREKLLANGRAQNCGVYKENEAAARAMSWIGANFRVSQYPGHVFYNIYGIERAGRLSGQRFLGKHDWYREGCKYLVSPGEQKEDGSWVLNAGFDRMPVVSTSFALLFLSKGRTPVLISKLVHGPGEDWNNDRYDARNLVDYASLHMFKKQPLAWQIFDARRVELDTRPRLLEEVGNLLQSPILYFNGHEAPIFRPAEEEMIKEYVNQGGFILAEACCGDPRFDKGFRAMIGRLFGADALKRLDPDHPIWRTHADVPPNNPFELYGIKQGCKTVLVYCPQDLSCLWEANKMEEGRGRLAFRLGGNIIAYATGMELPKPRLTRTEVLDDQQVLKTVPRGYLKVAQLHHDGDWQPAPKAVQNLMLHLREKARLDVVLKPEELSLGEKLPDKTPAAMNFKFLYMHGRKDFSLDETELKNLRAALKSGGILFADACCGKKEFDTAFRRMIDQLFAKEESRPKLEPIPLADELFSKELNPEAISSVRCRRERPEGDGPEAEFRDVAPYLEGLKLNNRWVVIYSKYDIGCALEKHQSPDCMGHDYASALKLGGAVVLYALKR